MPATALRQAAASQFPAAMLRSPLLPPAARPTAPASRVADNAAPADRAAGAAPARRPCRRRRLLAPATASTPSTC